MTPEVVEEHELFDDVQTLKTLKEWSERSSRHAEARRIDVELRYERRQFRLRVRDDGKGIDPAVLNSRGRQGHFGLPGMQERAMVVGGKLAVYSRSGAGTEVELTIPASFAYRKSTGAPPLPSGKGA